MAPLKNRRIEKKDDISVQRAFKAAFLTFLSLALLFLWCYHAVWSIKVFTYNKYGNILNNLVFGLGTLIINASFSIKFATYLNDKYLNDQIDADHKKYM